jgi:hypothetical protein
VSSLNGKSYRLTRRYRDLVRLNITFGDLVAYRSWMVWLETMAWTVSTNFYWTFPTHRYSGILGVHPRTTTLIHGIEVWNPKASSRTHRMRRNCPTSYILQCSSYSTLRLLTSLPPTTQTMRLLAIILLLSGLACAKKNKPPLPECFGECDQPGKQRCFGTSFPSNPVLLLYHLTGVILVGNLAMTCFRKDMCWRNTKICRHGCKYRICF